MTKAELLAELAARDFVSAVGTPAVLETKPDGTKWYNVNIREAKGNTATYRNVNFYVVDEDGPSEAAFFKDVPPEQTTRIVDLKKWMRDTIDASPNSYKAAQVNWISERWEMIVYSILEDDATDLKWQAYYVRKGEGAPKKITNHEAWRIASLVNV